MTSLELQDRAASPVVADGPVLTPDELLAEAQGRFCARYGNSFPRPSWACRLVEITLAATALVMFLPLLLLIGWLVRRSSQGPALFRQVRIRQGLSGFRFYKFRTMVVDGDQRYPSLVQFARPADQLADFKFKVENDPRITRVGAWLRRTSLDELPNLWNLLTGEVALVGPRPEIPAMLANYDDAMLKKFTVRPGITGLAQVCGRGDLTFLETIGYDLEYIETRSVWLDCKIVFLTLFGCLTGRGAK